MAAHTDVKDIGMAKLKLPGGEELELPFLQVCLGRAANMACCMLLLLTD